MKTYVMAPMLKIAERWAQLNDIPPDDFRYINRHDQLFGLDRGIEITALRNWQSNKTRAEVEAIIEIMVSRKMGLKVVDL